MAQQFQLKCEGPTFVYRLFDSAGVLLYIGNSIDPGARMAVHRQTRRWWEDVASMTAVRFPTKKHAEAEEARAIREEHPLHNVQHSADPYGTRGVKASMAERVLPTISEMEDRLAAGEWLTVKEATRLIGADQCTVSDWTNKRRTSFGLPLRFRRTPTGVRLLHPEDVAAIVAEMDARRNWSPDQSES